MKQKITAVLFLTVLFLFFFLHLAMPDQELSTAERRHMEQFPPVSPETVFSGAWMKDFEDYTLDQFPFRESFRSLKANAMFHLFHFQDNHHLFMHEDHIVKMEYPLNEKSFNYFTKKLSSIEEMLPETAELYLAVIPDKNYYIEDSHLRLPYESLFSQLQKELPGMTWISLDDSLTLDSFYKTDLHWRQEMLNPVVETLAEVMHTDLPTVENTSHSFSPFYGAYAGQAAMPVQKETLYWLTNDFTDASILQNYEYGREEPLYTTDKLNGMDPYDVFLTGPSPLLTLRNPLVQNGKKLLLFRDSFGSSLAPLLLGGYEEITLLDLRYISMEKAAEYIDFHDYQVLFLYSTTLINKSFSLK